MIVSEAFLAFLRFLYTKLIGAFLFFPQPVKARTDTILMPLRFVSLVKSPQPVLVWISYYPSLAQQIMLCRLFLLCSSAQIKKQYLVWPWPTPKNMTFSAMVSGSIHTCDLLSVNYLLNNGLYCPKWSHSHLLFGQCLPGLRSSITGVYQFLRLYGLNSLGNRSRLMNFRCEWTLSTAVKYNDRYIETKFWFSSHSASNFLICAF